MKVLLILLLLVCVSGCENKTNFDVENSKSNPEIVDANGKVEHIDYMNVLCEDLEIEIMNYENGDSTKEDLISTINLSKADCNEDREICTILNKELADDIKDSELLKLAKEIERSCYAD